jgi:thioredoxin-related protein
MQIKRTPALRQLLSEKYYFVTMNAEDRRPIVFNDTTYPFIPAGSRGIHALAAKLMHQPVAYPAWVLLDTAWQVKGFHGGLLKAGQLKAFLISHR